MLKLPFCQDHEVIEYLPPRPENFSSLPKIADLLKVDAEAESSRVISAATAATEDEDEVISSFKRRKCSNQDADSGSSSSSQHMYEDPVDDHAGTAAEKSNVAGSAIPRKLDKPVLLNS